MPIIETSRPGAPLSQGDILRDINLFSTGEAWGSQNGTAMKSPRGLCLILSRPCVIEHKNSVIVAGIDKLPDNTPRDADTFKRILSFLTNLRDGGSSPDVFYLGQLPGLSGRYAARFDDLHTIQVPPTGPERVTFADAKRIGVLHRDFARDLHIRLFRAVASMGFDDHGWLSDSDLRWLVDSGRGDLLEAQAAAQGLRAKRSGQEAQGARFDERELQKAEKEERDLAELLRPYEEEYRRRGES
jgi:hypothetical protein